MKKSDWLTIPDAPNYEINSALQVRNKKTSRILQGIIFKGKRRYLLRADGKTFTRNADTLLRQAKAAVSVRKWYPVPSLDNRYEFNDKNQLRNAITKRHLTLSADHDGYKVQMNKKFHYVCIFSLRWEIFGEPLPFGSAAHKQVIISKGNTTLYFDQHAKAAKFIANAEIYSANYIEQLLIQRRKIIFGWTINYLEDER